MSKLVGYHIYDRYLKVGYVAVGRGGHICHNDIDRYPPEKYSWVESRV